MPHTEHTYDRVLPDKPKIIFMGTPDFALPSLAHLIQHHYPLAAVVTQPDRPKGRGRKVSPPPVKVLALDSGIEVLQPAKVLDEVFLKEINAKEPDLIIVVAYGQILKKEFLDIPKYGVINIHASLLPKYRGAAPIQCAILNRETETGLTIMRMDEGLDTGPILLQESVPIRPDETAGQLTDRLAEKSGPLIIRFLEEAAKGLIQEEIQDSSKAVYAPKIEKEQALISWHETAAHIAAMIRAYDPLPGARTTLKGEMLKLFHPRFIKEDRQTSDAGRVIKGEGEGLFVETGKGVLEIKEVQYTGKKRMSAIEFLRGFPMPPEIRLGA
jgi:methionyl-tRNA formyltransferase